MGDDQDCHYAFREVGKQSWQEDAEEGKRALGVGAEELGDSMTELTRTEIDAIIQGLYLEYHHNRIPVPPPHRESEELAYWWGRWAQAPEAVD